MDVTVNIICWPACQLLSLPGGTDLQLIVIHAVCVAVVELRVVGHVQQLNDQVTGQQLCHKWMLKEQGRGQNLELE